MTVCKIQLLDETAFAQLSVKEKRVALCRDVIARLDAQLLVAHSGGLFKRPYHFSNTLSLKNALNDAQCEACAKGALIVAWIGNFNKYEELSVFDFRLHNYPHELIEIFGEKLLSAIECAYESHHYNWHREIPPHLADSILSTFGEAKFLETPYNTRLMSLERDPRMRAVFNNLIDNGGVMKLNDGTEID